MEKSVASAAVCYPHGHRTAAVRV